MGIDSDNEFVGMFLGKAISESTVSGAEINDYSGHDLDFTFSWFFSTNLWVVGFLVKKDTAL